MPDLSLNLLGSVEIHYDGRPLAKQRATKVMALLIYLVCNRDRVHERERLMGLLWPGLPQTSAQTSLRQTVYRLRRR